LMPKLSSPSFGVTNKGTTSVKLTIAATDNVGNTTTVSTTWTVNLTFSTVGASISTNVATVTFNTLATNNGNVSISFVNVNNGYTYTASGVTAPTGTTKVATITEFVSGGNIVTPANMPSGYYKVYVSGIVSANNLIPVSNSGAEFKAK